MSDGDEYQKQLDRLTKLEADVTKNDMPQLKCEPSEAQDNNSDSSSSEAKENNSNGRNSPIVSDVEINSNSEEVKEDNNTEQPMHSEKSESSDGSYYKRRNGGPQRVTRNATGSLPKLQKSLLAETTVTFDPAKSKQPPPRSRPGFFNVIAPECTACGSDVILRVYQRRMLLHPYLKTAICRQCHEFYHSDAFDIDDEGSQIFCVWCGEGGELIYCDRCEKAFCTDCIRRNFGKKVKNEIMHKNSWDCFICVSGPTENLKKLAVMIVKYQNLCIKDPLLVKKFQCEVTKAEIENEDYQALVSSRIRIRNTAKLQSSSQQKEESQKSESSDVDSEDSEVDKSNNQHSESSSASDYEEASKNDRVKGSKHSKQPKQNGSAKASGSSDTDDDAFLACIRKKATVPKETSRNYDLKKKEKVQYNDSTKKALPSSEKDGSSDDSLFDTGNPSVKAKKFRKQLQSSDDNGDHESDVDEDEVVQKYKAKLAKFKEVSDKEDSAHSNFSAESLSESDSSEQKSDKSSHSDIAESDGDADDENKSNSSKKKKGKKRKKGKSNSASGQTEKDSSDEKPKKKRRRKKKRKDDTSSESSDDDSENEENGDKKKKRKGKRKKIRKILGSNQLDKDTVKAQEAEDARRSNLKNKLLPSQQGKIANFILEDLRKEKYRGTPPTLEDEEKGRVIEVHKHLKKKLKPHQLDGIQFMYDCCMESVEKVKKGSEGSGCILAHCMGLGKTFQVIAFVSTVLNFHYLFGLKRALVVCPLNTIRNWKAEFDKWLRDMDDAPEVYILTDNITNNDKRVEIIEDWYETSGVLIIGYSMYRLLSQGTNIRKKHLKETFKKCLMDPGPDIVICDEGHMIKNEKTGISKALNSLKTKRRIILTGTPLQNNLVEYHCMVSFVKPSLLGTVKEFRNMYENPINNGQCNDATEFDIKLMKERAHILFEQLSGCVQRRDYIVLKQFLPEKFEYVLSIKLSDLQVKLYQKFLDKANRNGKVSARLFECYQTLKKVWTHPWLLEIDAIKNERDSIEDFITDRESSEDSWEASGSSDSDFGNSKKAKNKSKNGKDKTNEQKNGSDEVTEIPEAKEVNGDQESADAALVKDIVDTIIPDNGPVDFNWFKGEMTEKDSKMLEHSGKLLVTLEILDKASQKGDKVLLFSQSLLALDFLETSINRVGWMKGWDYYRMDGSTKTAHREMFQKKFNDKSNKRCRLFLISTKAGGLGINLVSANRIILFDMSWNPSDDTQSLFRAFRYGQTKNVYVYRLVARGTMEEKIYDRQVYKESLASRVVDEKQIKAHFSSNDLQQLFVFDPSAQTCTTSVLANHNPPADDVLASILVDMDPPLVLEYHEHDSLLEHRPEQTLTEEERKAAWANFKADKERKNVVAAPMGQRSVFQRLAAHTEAYAGPMITPIFSSDRELILGGFTNGQILSIQQQLEPVVLAGRLTVKPLGGGKLHIDGLGPEQQQVFINSIKQQQAQQIQQAQIARVLPQQHILNQLSAEQRVVFNQRLAELQLQQQQLAQIQTQQQQQQVQQQQPKPTPTLAFPTNSTPITIDDSPSKTAHR